MIKRKIQDIIVKKQKRVVFNKMPEKETEAENFKVHNYFTKAKENSRRNGRISRGKIIFGVFLFLLFLVVGAKTINAFSKAVIQIQLHQEIINVDSTLKGLIAGKTITEPFDLSVQTMEIQISEERSLAATGKKIVEKKASGQIVIYNAYSSSAQPFIERTRFETPDGKIYRIQNKIIVPGAKIEEGKIAPSSIETTVYANSAGEEYNIDLTDFTIPGFKGDPRYDGFYARSKTPMAGGFKGEVPIVSEEDETKLKESIEKTIEERLWQQAKAQTPEDFVLYSNAAQITFSENQISARDKNIFTMKKEGFLFAYLLNKEGLSRSLVKKYLGEDLVDKVRAYDLDNLKFQMVSLDEKKGTVVFQIQGMVKFVWIIEEEEFKKSLIASSGNMEKVFKNYPAIEKASVVFKPSWWRFFPNKASKIQIESLIK
ncbi:MAG: hypothetical protein COT67_02160 [Candidatus Tagabacteria bacterium CG09_land_8_20_14_0_10_41_14]|uniref:Baseplate protein J-like domain-containing protein n=2 Tax=Candidatus Tagaibacteriota TaxID=1817918 RepID=A0A2H0WL11_9BACT|nr:MAG: hypothetical protein COT67_02160 [Candidatus Tagabacteria bacterium CG09_land_8_20_14_0_10_41_14]PJE72938.1 MAG: hypothetical protein COV00_02500 [Candidatus Tagabacteria bacterium CG10_big_fil_rev_8_21_14_0_10_40_13]